jgi:uncharacterized protein YcfL
VQKIVLVILVGLLTVGCVDSQNGYNIHLGDVSLGQQLIDLKAALDAEAISEDEYESLKKMLVEANSYCGDAPEVEEADEGFKFF